MTLHWWMHWFWVTTLLIIFVSSGKTLAAPQSEELQHMNTDLEVSTQRPPERQGRAMYYTKPPHFIVNNTKIPPTNNSTEKNQTNNNKDIIKNTNKDITTNVTTKNVTVEIVNSSLKLTNTNSTESLNLTQIDKKETIHSEDDDPLDGHDDSVTTLLPPMYTNVTEQNSTLTNKNLTRPDVVKDEGKLEGIGESKIVTDKPLSLEIQTRIPPIIESSRRVIDFSDGGMDTGAIAGVSFAALVLAALAGSTAFVLYRRRYLNKPQTLNDKCSNPDSSGYLDDSTIRDNSEEMYSLDNDSFLNSLEAMTIQNYWTDTVKHTKL